MNKTPTSRMFPRISPKISLIVGSSLLTIAIIGFFVISCKSPFEKYGIFLFLIFGFAFIGSLIGGTLKIGIENGDLKGFGTGGLGILLLLIILKPDINRPDCQIVSFSVYVHGLNGKQDRVLKNKGEVMLDVDGFSLPPQKIDHIGRAIFEYLPAEASGKYGLISVVAPTYKARFPDSMYLIGIGKSIYLEVTRKGLNIARGYITDSELNPIDSAIVSIQDIRSEMSSKSGYFSIEIPPNKQKEKQTITVTKIGYKTWQEETEIDSTVEMKFILDKIRK